MSVLFFILWVFTQTVDIPPQKFIGKYRYVTIYHVLYILGLKIKKIKVFEKYRLLKKGGLNMSTGFDLSKEQVKWLLTLKALEKFELVKVNGDEIDGLIYKFDNLCESLSEEECDEALEVIEELEFFGLVDIKYDNVGDISNLTTTVKSRIYLKRLIEETEKKSIEDPSLTGLKKELEYIALHKKDKTRSVNLSDLVGIASQAISIMSSLHLFG